MNLETINRLQALSDRASSAADEFAPGRLGEAEERYGDLRGEAEALNLSNGWMSVEQFDTMFPTLQAQDLIEQLDGDLGAAADYPVEQGASVQRLLRHLGHWATGVAHALSGLRESES